MSEIKTMGQVIAERELADAKARAEKAEARLASLAESGTGYSQETVDALTRERGQLQGEVTRLTSEVERLWACVELVDRSSSIISPEPNEHEAGNAIKARSLSALEAALGIEGGRNG